MGINIRITDEHFGKSKLSIFELNYLTEKVTIRDIITNRVEKEIVHVNFKKKDPVHIKAEHRMFLAGLTKISPEVLLNANSKQRHGKPIDVSAAIETALDAFRRGHFFILYKDRQYENLEDQIILTPDNEIIFLRLTPLMGG